MLADKPIANKRPKAPWRLPKRATRCSTSSARKGVIIVARKESWVLEQLHTLIGNRQWAAEDKCADSVRSDDYRHQCQKGIVEERPRVDRNFVETKEECYRGRHDRVETEERREGDKYAYRKSKRRPLGWIIDRKQTAECSAKHQLIADCQLPIANFESQDQIGNRQSAIGNEIYLLKTLQRFRLVIIRVEDGEQFGDHQ